MVDRTIKLVISLLFCSLLVSCTKTNPHPQDPLEGFNREVYGFNRAIDKGIIRPIAYTYYSYTPKVFQTRVHNFFSNLSTLPTIGNDFLQFKIAYAMHDISRFLINSTIGIGGLFDVAHRVGLTSRSEDFGQTLYHWGLHQSVYVVLPILGPSTLRDTFGMVVDAGMSVWPYIESESAVYQLKAAEAVDTRATYLRNEPVLESVGVDEYAFVRNAYLQRRTFVAYDGSPPEDQSDTDPFDDASWLDEDSDSHENTNEAKKEDKQSQETSEE